MKVINRNKIESYIGINNNLCEEYTRTLLVVTIFHRRRFMQKKIYDIMFQVACNNTFQNYTLQFIRYLDITNSKDKRCTGVIFR